MPSAEQEGANGQLDRTAVLASLGLIAINLAVTSRWADVPGALRGWRWPFIVVAIVLAAISAIRRRPAHALPLRWLPRLLLWTGSLLLVGEFLFEWFPPATWRFIPFTDDWPPRFSSTVEGLALLRRGAFGGWQWNLLGGYSTATDITQNLTVLGAIPMTVFGDAVGFHLLHFLLFLALPVLVLLDLRESRAAVAAAGLVAWSACSFSWAIIRSGDSNSLAGVVCVMAVLASSHRARGGARYGFALLVIALTLTAYAHIGFLAYAIGLLILEAGYYGDWRQLRRGLAATGLALVASLPVTFELLRYPTQFNFNNVLYVRSPIDWPMLVRRIGYNVQILLSPGRWFNDSTKLFGPIVLLAAWRRDGRAGFYAWAAIFAVGLTLLNVPEAGYVFARPAHLPVVFTPVVLAWFITTRWAGAVQAVSFAAVAMLCVPVATGFHVPHQSSVAEFVPRLVDRLKTCDGNMILLENNPHRDVDPAPDRTSEKSLYGTHYEALVPAATNKRLYAGYWDGWQFTPFRGEMLAGGAWQGHLLNDTDHAAFIAELGRWGIRHVFVWSHNAKAVLATWPELVLQWSDGPWREFELADPSADVRSVVTVAGRGELVERDPLGGLIRLTDVHQGDRVVVRTHYHPAWQAFGPSASVPTIDVGGQLGFAAPASGSYDVRLVYPTRRWLLVLGGLVLGLVVVRDRRRH
jgi:hypothetical protein